MIKQNAEIVEDSAKDKRVNSLIYRTEFWQKQLLTAGI